jgi:hypothetical protein
VIERSTHLPSYPSSVTNENIPAPTSHVKNALCAGVVMHIYGREEQQCWWSSITRKSTQGESSDKGEVEKTREEREEGRMHNVVGKGKQLHGNAEH